MKNYYLPIALAVLLCSCGGNKTEEETETMVETLIPDIKNQVTVETLHRGEFNHELISNGKLTAQQAVDLRFDSAEPIAEIFVKNGDRVRKGQPLASLALFRLTTATTQAQTALAQAKLEMQDLLIGQGYALADSLKVPAATQELVGIKSGYTNALSNYNLAVHNEKNAILKAPFDGVVANLFSKVHNIANPGETFCTIIDTRNLEVSFTILENELPLVKTGDKVEVAPFSSLEGKTTGRISEINPVVDENGMVKVKASLQNNGKLFEGMNVRVKIQRSLPGQLVIPKSAVVLRSGKQVVFTLTPDNKAEWHYVETELENSTHYTVNDKLQEGHIVIVSGNINLAHDAPVEVIK